MFTFRDLDQSAADAIVSWRYEPPYDFYDLTADIEDLDEFLDPSRWGVSLFGAYVEDDLVGYIGLVADGDVVEIGLGLRPDWTGRGYGLEFVNAILDFARERFSPREFRLKVARFNERAIRVYERTGFSPVREFVQRTNGGEWPFVEMTRPV
jgi:ribosomal-protein-alanine N-acetyltransferase